MDCNFSRWESAPASDSTVDTLAGGLDRAALGDAGYNFYGRDGRLLAQIPYAQLQASARALATRFMSMYPRNARIAIMGETIPAFHIAFFACQYSGHIAVPLPLPSHTGGKSHYLTQCRQMIETSGAVAVIASLQYLPLVHEALDGGPQVLMGTVEDFMAQPEGLSPLQPFLPEESCYIQYSSGSTSFPKGVVGTQRSVTSNIQAIVRHGLKSVPEDRCVSWLPLYHDMGLVGCALAPMIAQVTVDYLTPTDFARRPLLWLELISRNRGTVSFAPTFGYDICVRRMGSKPGDSLDLASWRVAGIGGDMIRPDILDKFAEVFSPMGFRRSSFLPSYGLAESTLAVTFTELDEEFAVDDVHIVEWQGEIFASPGAPPPGAGSARHFVVCGEPLPGHQVAIRDFDGRSAVDRQVGRVMVRGPSVMLAYFRDAASTSAVLEKDGWLDTGDLGYLIGNRLVVTGRSKDMMHHNGRNIWPEDIEWGLARHFNGRISRSVVFSVNGKDGDDRIVTVIEAPKVDEDQRPDFLVEARQVIIGICGVSSEIVLARSGAIPLTSSGKAKRSETGIRYVAGELTT